MKFINPQFLWAFGVLLIPIIIHLFNFRRFKRVVFPNLRFLEEVQLKTKNRQELKKYLVLASRLLALSFLVMAFAGPFIPGNDEGKSTAGNVLSVYIDNSFSMNAEGKDGELLEVAKNRARKIVAAYGETDRFQLLTNDFEGRHQRAVSKENFLTWVDEVAYSSKSRKLSEVYERQKNQLLKEGGDLDRLIAFQISDFQNETSDIDAYQADSLVAVYFVPLEANERNNISIDSAWFTMPYVRLGESAELNVRLSNRGNNKIDNGTVILELNGSQKGLASYDLESNTSIDLKIQFVVDQEGWNKAMLSIQDFPVVFDDKLYFSFKARNESKVLLVVDEVTDSKNIQSVYQTEPFFKLDVQESGNLDYSSFKLYDVIILAGIKEVGSGLSAEITQFVLNGGSLVFFPAKEETTTASNLFSELDLPLLGSLRKVQDEISQISLEHPIYQSVIEKANEQMPKPGLFSLYPWQNRPSGIEQLLSTRDGQSVLALFQRGKGKVYFFSIHPGLEHSGLSRHFLFPSTLLQIGFRSMPGQSIYYRIGCDWIVPIDLDLPGKEEIMELNSESGVYIPELVSRENKRFLQLSSNLQQAGNYDLRKRGETEVLQSLSLNFERLESGTMQLSNDELLALVPPGLKSNIIDVQTDSLSKTIRELDSGTQLWKLAVILALLFVSIEILLLRYLKTA